MVNYSLCGDVLYHYCSMESFIKIIETKTIRMGNVVQMNDPTELKLRTYNWVEIIYKHYLSNPFNFNFLYYGKKLDIKQYLQLMIPQQNTLKSDNYFAFCLSSKRDDLNQWRVYGDNGKGVCLGFNVKNILKLKENDSDFDYIELEYVDLNMISEAVAESILCKIRDRYLADKNDDLYKIAADFYSELEFFVLKYKHKAYESEAESRLVYRESTPINNGELTKLENVIIETNNSLINTYKEIKLATLGLNSIIFGPTNQVPLENVLLYLSSKGINMNAQQIFYSDIPYRTR